MRADAIHFDEIRYNPALEAFEAHVQVTDCGEILHYGVSVSAPVTAEYKFIARRLREAALAAHSRARGAMRLRRFAEQPTAMAA